MPKPIFLQLLPAQIPTLGVIGVRYLGELIWNGSSYVDPSTVADTAFGAGGKVLTAQHTSNGTATLRYVADDLVGSQHAGSVEWVFYDCDTTGNLRPDATKLLGRQSYEWDGTAHVTIASRAKPGDVQTTILPLQSSIAAPPVGRGPVLQAYQNRAFSFGPWAFFESDGTPADLSGATLKLTVYDAYTQLLKFVVPTDAGSISVSGADSNQVTIIGSASLTVNIGRFKYVLDSQTPDMPLATGVFPIDALPAN